MKSKLFFILNFLLYSIFSQEIKFQFEDNSNLFRNQEWGTWNWTSWVTGPPCPQKYDAPNFNVIQKNLEIINALKKIDHYISNTFLEIPSKKLGIKSGLSIGIVYDQDILWTNNYGTISPDSTTIPTENTIYRLGSITKIFTSLMFAKANEESKVHLDDPLTKFYNSQTPPKLEFFNGYEQKKARTTLHQLSTQSSGLPREPPCGLFPDLLKCSEEIIFAFLNTVQLFTLPFSDAHYSNLGITLLGRALERAVGKKYESYMVDDIFYKLGMNSTGFNFTSEIKSRMAQGTNYDTASKKQVPNPVSSTELGWPAPCGGAYSSVSDMMTFLKFILNSDYKISQKQNVISLSKKNEYILPGILNQNGASNYGLYTFENVFANEKIINTKGGLIGGFGSSIAFQKDLKIGVFAVWNLNSGGIDAVTTETMNILIPVLQKVFENNQPKYPVYDGIDIVGNWGVEGASLATISQSPTPGLYDLSLLNSTFPTYKLFYFPKLNQKNQTIFFYSIKKPIPLSCLLLTGLGDGSLARLDFDTTFSFPDQNIWNLRKM